MVSLCIKLTNRAFILLFFNFCTLFLFSQNEYNKEENLYKIRYFNSDTEIKKDTIVSLNFLDDNLYLYDRFLYPKLENRIVNDSVLILKNDSISLVIKTNEFNMSEYEVDYQGNTRFVEKLNQKQIWGVDGDLPNKTISKIQITFKERVIKLNESLYDDLFEPNFGCFNEYQCAINCYIKNDEIILSMLNSDGAGGYTAIFIIGLDGIVKERLVGFGF